MPRPNQTPRKPNSKRRGSVFSGGVGRLLSGVLLGMLLAVAGAVVYFASGASAITVTDRSAAWEYPVRSLSMHARSSALTRDPPFPASEDAFEAGARVYHAQCAQCHGTPAHEAMLGRNMAPRAQQFFSVRDRKATSAQSAGELYWKTAFGLRRSGMPAYKNTLTDTQLWQTSLLLHSANEDLPDPVRALLTEQPSHAESGQPTAARTSAP